MGGEYWPLILEIASWVLVLSVCFFVTIMHFLMEPFRWNYCYQSADGSLQSRQGVRDALLCTSFATYVLPFKLGIPLRLFLIRRNGGLSLYFIGAVVTLDGLISLLMWAVVAAICSWVTALHWSPPWYLWVTLLVGVLACVVVMVVRHTISSRILQQLRDALVLLDHPWSRVGRSAMILLADVLSYGLRHALLLLLVTGSVIDMLIGGAVGIIATFAGIVSGLPMGLVGYDATLVVLLTIVGVRPEQALLVAVINRALNLAAAALLGVPAALRLGLGLTVRSIIRKFREIAHDRV